MAKGLPGARVTGSEVAAIEPFLVGLKGDLRMVPAQVHHHGVDAASERSRAPLRSASSALR